MQTVVAGVMIAIGLAIGVWRWWIANGDADD
jgi:hypothetical protein